MNIDFIPAGINDASSQQKIKNSDLFICIVNDEYLKSAVSYVRLELAKEYNKPVHALVHKDTRIPDDHFDGIADLVVETFTSQDDLKRKILRLLES